MSNGDDDDKGAGVGSYPPPSPISGPRALSLVFAAAAAIAAFLGYCTAAGVLALLSLAFNVWDLFQTRGRGGSTSSTGGGTGSGHPRGPGRPPRA
jgi:hypothetical protein